MYRRLGREASKHCERVGCWSVLAASRVVSWDAHARRGHEYSWAADLIAVQGSRWLEIQRLAKNSVSAFAGTLGLREAPGRPRIRFHEGVVYAGQLLEQS